jgi:hypothetical protein
MPTTPEYDALLKEVDDALERQVLGVLMADPLGADRYQLVWQIYGVIPSDLANDKNDRKIREAIEHLREKWPIVSSSGGRGYKLTEDLEEIKAYAAEAESRARHLQLDAQHAYNWPRKVRTIREYRQTHIKVEQPGLF